MKNQTLATFVAAGRVPDQAPGTCIAWMDSADRTCDKPTDNYLCDRHSKVATNRARREVEKVRADRAKAAARAEGEAPELREQLDRVERRLKAIDPFWSAHSPFDHGELSSPLAKRMPSDTRIAELARLHARRKQLRARLGVTS